MTKTNRAVLCFQDGFTCSAAVFSAFSEEMGLDAATARKIACGFGGGLSKTGNLCGAVSGAVLAIGLKHGKAEEEDGRATEETRTRVRRFIEEFSHRHGSINCTDLLGYNLGNPDEYETARQEGLFTTKCPKLVRDAAAILERVL